MGWDNSQWAGNGLPMQILMKQQRWLLVCTGLMQGGTACILTWRRIDLTFLSSTIFSRPWRGMTLGCLRQHRTIFFLTTCVFRFLHGEKILPLCLNRFFTRNTYDAEEIIDTRHWHMGDRQVTFWLHKTWRSGIATEAAQNLSCMWQKKHRNCAKNIRFLKHQFSEMWYFKFLSHHILFKQYVVDSVTSSIDQYQWTFPRNATWSVQEVCWGNSLLGTCKIKDPHPMQVSALHAVTGLTIPHLNNLSVSIVFNSLLIHNV